MNKYAYCGGWWSIFFFYSEVKQIWRLLHLTARSNVRKHFFSRWIADTTNPVGNLVLPEDVSSLKGGISVWFIHCHIPSTRPNASLAFSTEGGREVCRHRWTHNEGVIAVTLERTICPVTWHHVWMNYPAPTMQNPVFCAALHAAVWVHGSLHKHEPFHIIKAGLRALVEKGLMMSQEHGEGREKSQNKWNQIQIPSHEVMFSDCLLLFPCPLRNWFPFAHPGPTEKRRFLSELRSWGKVPGRG